MAHQQIQFNSFFSTVNDITARVLVRLRGSPVPVAMLRWYQLDTSLRVGRRV